MDNMKRSETVGALAAALANAQGEMKPAKMDAVNPFLKNSYADLGSVIESIRPILADNGLSFMQLPAAEDGRVQLETIVMHASGEWISSTQTIAIDAERGLSQAQITGKAITYLRRYALAAMFGVYADKDDDGNEARPSGSMPAPAAVSGNGHTIDQDTGEILDPLIARWQGKRKNFASAPMPSPAAFGPVQGIVKGIVGSDEERHRFYALLFGRELSSATDLTPQEAAWLVAFVRPGKTPDGWAAAADAEQEIASFMQRHPAPEPTFPAAEDLHPESAHLQPEPA